MQKFNLNIFQRVFAQSTNDFGVIGAKLLNDGSGETNFRASHFEDNMNAATISTRNWRVTETGTMEVNPVTTKGHLFTWTGGGSVGDEASLILKGAYGRINETGFIIFTLKIAGFLTGSGMDGLLQADNTAGEQIFMGMYKDEDNRIGIINDGSTTQGEYKLITVYNGNVTSSSSFTIANESNPDQLIEIKMEITKAEAYLDGVLLGTCTSNIPDNAELKPLLRLKHSTGMSGDNILSVNYLKLDQ